MKTIYKYEIEIKDKFYVSMPIDSKILKVDVQHEVPYIWVLVNTDNIIIQRELFVKGTGHPIVEDELKYIDSFFQGVFVWHLFES